MAVSSLLLSRVAPYRGEGKISRVVQNGVDLSLVPENEARQAALGDFRRHAQSEKMYG